MASEKGKPQFMIVYKCTACGQESGFTELDTAVCRYCKATEGMEEISKQELTAEVMAERLRKVTESMMKNMESAFQSMPDLEKGAMGENVDPELEMLKIMGRMQKLRDQVQNLKLKKRDENEKP